MINCIVAVDKNQGIGFNGQLPWPHLKEDMLWFKTITSNNVVVMGSKTFKSLPKPLPNRINVVISKNKLENCDHTFNDPGTALDFLLNKYQDKEIFIIGGEAIYQQYMDIIDRFYITEINHEYQCDRYFDLTYVKNNAFQVKKIAEFSDPVPYSINEYLI